MELMKQIDGVLFDLDGTLIDSFPDFLQSLKTLSIRGKETIISEKNVRALVSDGSSKLINEVFGISELDDDFFHLKKEFLSNYEKNILKYGGFFDGSEKLLRYLNKKKIPFGIVTNKPRKYTEIIINKNSLLASSKITICCDDGIKSKPSPEGIIHACREMKVIPKNCLFLGDHDNDLRAALNAEVYFGACLFGYGFQNIVRSEKVKNFLSNEEIIKFIKEKNGS